MKATSTTSASSLRSEIVSDVEALSPHLGAWDALAVAAGRPFCAPGWMLAWWREGRVGDARLRVVLVTDATGRLAGIGPFFAQVGWLGLAEYRLLAAGFCHRIGLLARGGYDAVVAAEVAGALAGADPTPASVVFEGIDQRDRWPELVAAAWPGRTRLRTDLTMDAPAIELEGDYERWLARRERKFRKEARRTARRLDEEGIRQRLTLDDGALSALVRLNEARWRDRGGSNLGGQTKRVLDAAAAALGRDEDRIAVMLLDCAGATIAAELVLRAGDSMAFWAGGFDADWARHSPGTHAMLAALKDAAADGVRWVDLGGGASEYKRRLADTNCPVTWRTLFPAGPRSPLIRLRLLPKHLCHWLRAQARRLPAPVQRRLRRLLHR